MDLGFSRMQARRAALSRPVEANDLSVMLAVSAAWQAATPTARALASVLRGQDEGEDRIVALTGVFAPRKAGNVDASSLRGSFNPLIAGQLTVGQD